MNKKVFYSAMESKPFDVPARVIDTVKMEYGSPIVVTELSMSFILYSSISSST